MTFCFSGALILLMYCRSEPPVMRSVMKHTWSSPQLNLHGKASIPEIMCFPYSPQLHCFHPSQPCLLLLFVGPSVFEGNNLGMFQRLQHVDLFWNSLFGLPGQRHLESIHTHYSPSANSSTVIYNWQGNAAWLFASCHLMSRWALSQSDNDPSRCFRKCILSSETKFQNLQSRPGKGAWYQPIVYVSLFVAAWVHLYIYIYIFILYIIILTKKNMRVQ